MSSEPFHCLQKLSSNPILSYQVENHLTAAHYRRFPGFWSKQKRKLIKVSIQPDKSSSVIKIFLKIYILYKDEHHSTVTKILQ